MKTRFSKINSSSYRLFGRPINLINNHFDILKIRHVLMGSNFKILTFILRRQHMKILERVTTNYPKRLSYIRMFAFHFNKKAFGKEKLTKSRKFLKKTLVKKNYSFVECFSGYLNKLSKFKSFPFCCWTSRKLACVFDISI